MAISSKTLHRLREVVRKHHNALILGLFGPDSLSESELKQAESTGIEAPERALAEDAYIAGQLEALDPQDLSLDQVRRHEPELTAEEQAAVDRAKHSAAQYVRKLGSQVEHDVIQEAIKEETAEAISERSSISELKTRLQNKTGQWERDWQRVAESELHTAREIGAADVLEQEHGEDALVFKQPNPDACPVCLRLYIGADGMPRIFRLSYLRGNGTNVGRKSAEALPVVGTVHPHCRCVLQFVPEGFGFNERGELVPGGKLGERFEGEEFAASWRKRPTLSKSLKRIKRHGMSIVIENPKGSKRHWTDANGRKGSTRMTAHYGYIENSLGPDGDEYDCFLGPDPSAEHAFIVHQVVPDTGAWDEDKVMLGWPDEESAKAAYLSNYTDPRFFGAMTAVPMKEFADPRFLNEVKKSATTPEFATVRHRPDLLVVSPGGAGFEFGGLAPTKYPPNKSRKVGFDPALTLPDPANRDTILIFASGKFPAPDPRPQMQVQPIEPLAEMELVDHKDEIQQRKRMVKEKTEQRRESKILVALPK